MVVVVLLLFLAPAVFSGGEEEFSPEVEPAGVTVSLEGLSPEQIYEIIVDLPPQELPRVVGQLARDARLDLARLLIVERRINAAVAILTGVVWEDSNELEKAEELFREIRAVSEEYLARRAVAHCGEILYFLFGIGVVSPGTRKAVILNLG